MYDFNCLKMSDIVQCGIAVRALGKTSESMEDAANKFVEYFFTNFVDKETGEKSCAQVRLFKTHDADKLPEDLQLFAGKLLQEKPDNPAFKCLTLLATTGQKKEWHDRKLSKGHQAIPLPSEEVINRIPMMRNLIKQMGLDVKTVVSPDPELLADLSKKTFNVFYVPDAVDSPYIPAQDDFVIPYDIKSVLGFGGILPSGNVFVIIIFTKCHISMETANLFNTLALNVKMLILPFEDRIFSN